MRGNPKIAEYGQRTRFGQKGGPDPSLLAKTRNPSSIKAALRRIAAMDFDDFDCFLKEPDKVTLAYATAIQKFQKALEGDVNAMQQLEDAIDGKLSKKGQKKSNSLL